MAETVLPPSADARETPQGVIPELVRFAGSSGRHVQGLLQLAGLETKEAALVGLRLLILLVAATVCSDLWLRARAIFRRISCWRSRFKFPGFGFRSVSPCCILLQSRSARFWPGSYLRTPVFKATAAELKRDFEALKNFKP